MGASVERRTRCLERARERRVELGDDVGVHEEGWAFLSHVVAAHHDTQSEHIQHPQVSSPEEAEKYAALPNYDFHGSNGAVHSIVLEKSMLIFPKALLPCRTLSKLRGFTLRCSMRSKNSAFLGIQIMCEKIQRYPRRVSHITTTDVWTTCRFHPSTGMH